MSGCNCYSTVNEKLAPHNTRIKSTFVIEANRIGRPWPIETSQIETGRGKPKAISLIASFCPFCGTSLRGEAVPAQAARIRSDDGVSQIAAERDRQRVVEGYSLDSDLMTYQAEELARAACCYAMPIRDPRRSDALSWCTAPEGWPFSRKAWKPAQVVLDSQGSVVIAPADRVRELVKAGALIAAQIDVLQAQGGSR